MDVSLDPHDRWSTAPRLRLLWTGLLLPAAAWVAHLGVVYPMASAVCAPSSRWLFYAVSAAALALALAGGWVAWSIRRTTAREPEDAPNSRARGRFMAFGGMLLSGIFSLAIVAQTIPIVVLEPCRY